MLSRIRGHLPPVLFLLVATVLVYYPVTRHEFLVNWDDPTYVTLNPDIRGFTASHLRHAFTSIYVGNYAPLHIISYMFDYSLWGMRAAGYFLTNIVLHAVNGILFYLLLFRMNGRRLWAFFAAFIFLLHPVQVESVAWVSQRKNLLAMTFFLAAFHLYVAYRDSDRGRGVRYSLSVTAFAAALLAKSVAVILPPVLILYDFCYPDRRSGKRTVRLADKVPYLLCAAAVAVTAYITQSPELNAGGGRRPYYGGSPAATFLTMLPVFVKYLRLLFWPADLSAFYSPAVKTGLDAEVAASAAVLAVVVVLAVWLFRRRKDLFFWCGVFFLGLLPVSQIVPIVTLMNDRYLYFPLLGASALIAGIVLPESLREWSDRRLVGGVVLISMLVAPLPFLSRERSDVWRNSVTLWSDAARRTPRSVVSWINLGDALKSAGDMAGAESAYRKSLALQPDFTEGIVTLGNLFLVTGRSQEASRYYLQALSLDPANKVALKNIGILCTQNNRIEDGRTYLERLTRIHPEYDEGFLTLGNNRYIAGDPAGAERAYLTALKLNPAAPQPAQYLGNVYLATKRLDLAEGAYLKALKNGGDRGEIEYGLACAASLAGRPEDSVAHLSVALRSGFSEMGRIARNRELDPVRGLPSFRSLIDQHARERSNRQ
jgi:protein O-mannosyl-transferase